MIKTLAIILIIFAGVAAQQPSPCSASELQASIAESRTLAERVRTEITRRAEMERAVTGLNSKLTEAQNTYAKLAASHDELKRRNAQLESTLAERDKMIILLANQRDWALNKIRKNNGRWLCEILHDGCIR